MMMVNLKDADRMRIIARKEQLQELDRICGADFPQFVVVYGRRRVGKTYLIREYFNQRFSFYASGVGSPKMKDQLKAFVQALQDHGLKMEKKPTDWMGAFAALKELLENDSVYRDVSGKRVIFLDEVPWMATKKSDFTIALDSFWNSYASMHKDIILIVCGSATSWILDHFVKDTGGFHHRVTSRLVLDPFTLKECEEYLIDKGMKMTRRQIIECYMVFGGVPYYLNLLDRRVSLSANIDRICFSAHGDLREEFQDLFRSLFSQHQKHVEVILSLAQKKSGMSRAELTKCLSFPDGGQLSVILKELEECRFIRCFEEPGQKAKNALFQVIDPFLLFAHRFLYKGKATSWQNYINTPSYFAWMGNAYEIVCLNHISQIKFALGIAGVETKEYSWRSKKTKGGRQIDLLLWRNDGIINLCEIKFTQEELRLNAPFVEELLSKVAAFVEEVRPKQAIHLTLISHSGVVRGEYDSNLETVIGSNELFAF